MPFRTPDPIAHIYDGHPIGSEDIVLDTEDSRPLKRGNVKVRALDGFLFVKGGRFVYPSQHRSDEWWRGVDAYGYIASLSGDFKYFIWAGQWDQDYDGKHMEVVILGNIRGLSLEANRHWRKGMEHILWLETELGYSYALLQPAEEYDRGGWTAVVESWRDHGSGTCSIDPSFHPIKPEDTRPEWWDKQGNNAWDYFVGFPQISPQSTKVAAASGLDRWVSTSKNSKANKPVGYVHIESSSSDVEDSTHLASSPPPRSKGRQKSRGKRSARNNRGLSDPEAMASAGLANITAARTHLQDSSSGAEAGALSTTYRKGAKSLGHGRKRMGVTESSANSNSRSVLKRRVISGALDPRPTQKKKAVEEIYVESGSSDDERLAQSTRAVPTPASGISDGAASSPVSSHSQGLVR